MGARSELHAKVIATIKQIHPERLKEVCGSPRMHLELVERGHDICETTVAETHPPGKRFGVDASQFSNQNNGF